MNDGLLIPLTFTLGLAIGRWWPLASPDAMITVAAKTAAGRPAVVLRNLPELNPPAS